MLGYSCVTWDIPGKRPPGHTLRSLPYALLEVPPAGPGCVPRNPGLPRVASTEAWASVPRAARITHCVRPGPCAHSSRVRVVCGRALCREQRPLFLNSAQWRGRWAAQPLDPRNALVSRCLQRACPQHSAIPQLCHHFQMHVGEFASGLDCGHITLDTQAPLQSATCPAAGAD